MKPGQAVFPVFEYDPRTRVLRYNAFGLPLTARGRREIDGIIAYLMTLRANWRRAFQPGSIPPAGVVIGWPGSGARPVNAVDTDDVAAMRPWRRRAYHRTLRITDVAATADETRSQAYIAARSIGP
jgi:hypothetical protein